MPRITIGTIVKLVLASFAAGVVMAYFEFTPIDLVNRAIAVGDEFMGRIANSAGDFISYVLLGAVIVVPIWLISYFLRMGKGGDERGRTDKRKS